MENIKMGDAQIQHELQMPLEFHDGSQGKATIPSVSPTRLAPALPGDPIEPLSEIIKISKNVFKG